MLDPWTSNGSRRPRTKNGGKIFAQEEEEVGKKESEKKVLWNLLQKIMSLLSGAAAATGVVAQHCCFFSKNEKRNGTCRLAEFGVWKNEKTKKRRIHLFFLTVICLSLILVVGSLSLGIFWRQKLLNLKVDWNRSGKNHSITFLTLLICVEIKKGVKW